MTREWTSWYLFMVYAGSGLFFLTLGLAWVKYLRKWWLRERQWQEDQDKERKRTL